MAHGVYRAALQPCNVVPGDLLEHIALLAIGERRQ